MEVTEAQELQEHHEHAAHNASMRPVALTMAILAVLVAVVTLLGHRASTESVLAQARASDNWAEYQAKRIRENDTALTVDLLSTMPAADKAAADALKAKYAQRTEQWNEDLKEAPKRRKSRRPKGTWPSIGRTASTWARRCSRSAGHHFDHAADDQACLCAAGRRVWIAGYPVGGVCFPVEVVVNRYWRR